MTDCRCECCEVKEWMMEWDDLLANLPNAGTYMRWHFQQSGHASPPTAHELSEAAALVRRMVGAMSPDETTAALTLAEADVLDAEAKVMLAKARRSMMELDMDDGE